MGYSLGCLLSILFWGINKDKSINIIINKVLSFFNKSTEIYKLLGTIMFSIIIIIVYYYLSLFVSKELYNLFTIFLVINISNKEKQSIKYEQSGEYESSIENLAYGIIYGFISPLCIIIVAGNLFAVGYFFLMIIERQYKNKGLHTFTNIINIIPCIIATIFIIVINIFRVNKLKNAFKLHNFKIFLREPLFGVIVIYSYLFDFNFPYYNYHMGTPSYIEYYGPAKGKKLDKTHTEVGLRQAYIICLFCFVLFILWYMKKIGVL